MIIAFFRVDNSKNYDRDEFNGWSKEETLQALNELPEDEVRIYNFDFYGYSGLAGMVQNASDFEQDYNDEILDGGWWTVVVDGAELIGK